MHDFQNEIKPPLLYQIKHNNNDNIKKKSWSLDPTKHVDEKHNEWLNDIEGLEDKQMKLLQINAGLITFQEF